MKQDLMCSLRPVLTTFTTEPDLNVVRTGLESTANDFRLCPPFNRTRRHGHTCICLASVIE